MLRRATLSFALLLTLAPAVLAQGTTSRLGGVVRDATNLVLPGVAVTITNEATGVSFTTVTTDAGTFVFEAIGSGSYAVKAELAGFKTVAASGNKVEIGQPTTVNLRMEPGELSETVQVVGAAERRADQHVGQPRDRRGTEGHRVAADCRYARPQPARTRQHPARRRLRGEHGGGTHVYGARDRSWNYTLDGIDSNETSAGGSTSLRCAPIPIRSRSSRS